MLICERSLMKLTQDLKSQGRRVITMVEMYLPRLCLLITSQIQNTAKEKETKGFRVIQTDGIYKLNKRPQTFMVLETMQSYFNKTSTNLACHKWEASNRKRGKSCWGAVNLRVVEGRTVLSLTAGQDVRMQRAYWWRNKHGPHPDGSISMLHIFKNHIE